MLTTEAQHAIAADAQNAPAPRGPVSIATLVANRDLIMAFVGMLPDLIPGVAGKVLGTMAVTAANAWFQKHAAPAA